MLMEKPKNEFIFRGNSNVARFVAFIKNYAFEIYACQMLDI